MGFTQDGVVKLGLLARLALSKEEIETYLPQISRIVEYFKQLSRLELEDTEPTSHIVEIFCPQEEDLIETSKQNIAQDLPWLKNHYFFVPRVIKE